MTPSIQALRGNAELGLPIRSTRPTTRWQQIAQINHQLAAPTADDATTAILLDQRDQYINQLSQLMDINVVHTTTTRSRCSPIRACSWSAPRPRTLSFNAQGTMTPNAQWNADPTKRTVGTITLTRPNGSHDRSDRHQRRSVPARSPPIWNCATRCWCRRRTRSTSWRRRWRARCRTRRPPDARSRPVPQAGFDLDLGGLLAGNSSPSPIPTTRPIPSTRSRSCGSTIRTRLPLSNAATARSERSGDRHRFFRRHGSVVSQLGSRSRAPASAIFQSVRIDPAHAGRRRAEYIDVNAVSVTTTVSSLTGGSAELPLFPDGSNPYTGAITAIGSQQHRPCRPHQRQCQRCLPILRASWSIRLRH